MRHSEYLNLNLPELIDKANILKVSESLEWIDEAVKQLNLIHAGINQRLTALELKVDAQDDTISDLRTNVSSVVSLCNSLSARLTTDEIAINAQGDSINNLRSELAALSSTCDSFASRLGTVETIVNSQGNSIINLRSELSTLASTCNEINARLTTAESGLTTANLRINDLSSDYNNLAGRTAATESGLAATNANLNALQTNYLHDIAEITSNVATTDGKVNALESRHNADIMALQLQLQNINANMQSVNDSIINLDERVTALEEGPQPEPPTPLPKFYVYYGGSAVETPSAAAVSSLPFVIYTDTVYRTISIPCTNQYCYYCVPADQPNVEFEVSGFTGGFEEPVTVPIAINEETVNYKVYRSSQILNGTATYKIKP